MLTKGAYGSVTNNYGVRITRGELARFKEAIPQANRIIGAEKRRRAKSPLKYGEFKMSLRIGDLGRFKTREAFLSYLKTAEKIARGTYFRQKAIEYRKNYIEALKKNYGSLADKYINRIKRLKVEEFRKLVESDKIVSIGFVYFETEGEAIDRITAMDDRLIKETGHGRSDGTTRTFKVRRDKYHKDIKGTKDITWIKNTRKKVRI